MSSAPGALLCRADDGGEPGGGGGGGEPGGGANDPPAFDFEAFDFDGFKSALPDDQQEAIGKIGFTNIDQIVPHLMNQEKLIGAPADQLLRLPADAPDKDPDAWRAVMVKLGAPEEVSGAAYGETPPDVEGLELKDGVWPKLSERFAQIGVPKQMLEPMMGAVGELVQEELAAAQQNQKTPEARQSEAMDALVGQHGQTQAEQMVADATQVLSAKGGAEFAAFLDESGFGNDPRMVSFLAKVKADYDESGIVLDAGRGAGGGQSAATAKAELERLEADPSFIKKLNDSSHPDHKSAVQKRLDLSKAAGLAA